MLKLSDMKIISLLITLMFCPLFISVYGRTIKFSVSAASDSLPIAGASVRITQNDSVVSLSAQTEQDGSVVLKTQLENCDILISCIGFKDERISLRAENRNHIDLGVIMLEEAEVKELAEVTIDGDRVINKIYKMIAFPTERQLKSSHSTLDLLQHMQLPGLKVDPVNQTVSIAGLSEVEFRLNGVKCKLQDILSLDYSLVQKVEYSQLPSIRELDSNSGVINIVLKKLDSGTFLYAEAMSAVATGFINGNASLKRVFSQSELSVNYNANWRNYKKRNSVEDEFFRNNEKKYDFHKIGYNAPFGYQTHDLSLGYTFRGEKNVLVTKLIGSFNSQHDKNIIDDIDMRQASNPFRRDIYAKFHSCIPSLDVYYMRKVSDAEGFEVNVVGTLIRSDYKRKLGETYTSKLFELVNTTDGKRSSVATEAFYYNNQHKLRYNFGVKVSYNHTRSIYDDTYSVVMQQVNLYPYTSLEGNIGKVSYAIGTGAKLLHNLYTDRDKTFVRNMTTLTLFYAKDTWSVRNTVQLTPSFPSIADMSDITQRKDSLMMLMGNSSVKPSQTIRENLNLSFKFAKNVHSHLTLNYANIFDPIRSSYTYDAQRKSFITQVKNQDYERNIGASLDVQVSPILKIFDLSAGVEWNNYKSVGLDFSHTFNNVSWYVECNAKIKNFSLYAFYRKPSEQLCGESIILNENSSTFAANYNGKNWSVYAGIMFPFSSGSRYGEECISSAYTTKKEICIKDNANMVFIGGTYSFSFGKSSSGVNKHIYNSDRENGYTRIKDN